MARLVYACRFEVMAADGWDTIIASYRDWLVDHYHSRRALKDFWFELGDGGSAVDLPAGHSLSSAVYEADSGVAICVRWSFPADNDVGLIWSNDIRLAKFTDQCSVEHLISIESVDYSVAPARLMFGSPRVVRDICAKLPIHIGEMRVQATPYILRQDGLENLLALLTSGLRRLPVVLLSPFANGKANSVDANQLAQTLAGVAVVVQITDPEVTWDLADKVGRQLSCYNGAARIYWPGFSMSASERNHRLFLASWIDQVGLAWAMRAIERTIFSVAVFRFAPNQRISDIVRAFENAERHRQLSERKATGDDFLEHYERDLERLEQSESRVRELEAENANLRANQQILLTASLTPEDPDEVVEDEELSFASVADAVKMAADECDNIEVLESAIEAARESPFQRPLDVYRALTDLNEIIDIRKRQILDKGSGGDLLQHLREHGWGKRSSMHISSTTRSKFRNAYTFEYQGKRQLFEPHLTIGSGDPNSCVSVHFILDEDRSKMIIGYVGKHLPNTKK